MTAYLCRKTVESPLRICYNCKQKNRHRGEKNG